MCKISHYFLCFQNNDIVKKKKKNVLFHIYTYTVQNTRKPFQQYWHVENYKSHVLKKGPIAGEFGTVAKNIWLFFLKRETIKIDMYIEKDIKLKHCWHCL